MTKEQEAELMIRRNLAEEQAAEAREQHHKAEADQVALLAAIIYAGNVACPSSDAISVAYCIDVARKIVSEARKK